MTTEIMAADFISIGLIPLNPLCVISRDSKACAYQIGADADRSVGMDHHPFAHFDRAISVELRVPGELRLGHKALRKSHGYGKVSACDFFRDFLIDGHPILR